MAQKKLEPGSDYAKYDIDGDGIVTDEELEMDAKMMRLENEDKKEDAQRHMAWFALFGMLLYPALVVVSVFTGLDKAAGVLGDMAPTYFVSVAAIVAAAPVVIEAEVSTVTAVLSKTLSISIAVTCKSALVDPVLRSPIMISNPSD